MWLPVRSYLNESPSYQNQTHQGFVGKMNYQEQGKWVVRPEKAYLTLYERINENIQWCGFPSVSANLLKVATLNECGHYQLSLH